MNDPLPSPQTMTTRRHAVGLLLGAPLLARCAGLSNSFSSSEQPPGPPGPPQAAQAVGNGQIKVGLILPLSGAGNAGVAGNSLKHAAARGLGGFTNSTL